MTILFANPPWWSIDRDSNGPFIRGGIRAGSRWPFTRRSQYMPDRFLFGTYMPFPFFLASAAAYVKRFEDYVEIRDSIARGESYESFFRYVEELKPTHLVVESGAAALEHDMALLAEVKSRLPYIRIALAGPIARSAFEAKKPDGPVDTWMLGEYEKNSLKFAQGARGLLDFNLLTREEMNELPHPLFDEEVALNYWDACPQGQQAPHLQLFTSRGCPYRCCFCAWPANMTGNDPDGTQARTVRFHSPEWVEGFIRAFLARHPETRSIYIDDDTFNLNDAHVLKICAVMKRIGLPWSAMCRADTSRPETWKAMREAGCFGVKLGFESGSQRVVDQIVNKRLDLKAAAQTAHWLRNNLGMSVHGTFTIGLPGETEAEKGQTRTFIDQLYRDGALDTHQLSGTAEIEGTPLATLRSAGHLAAYPGAKMDENYHRDPDGQHKSEAAR